MSEPLGMNVDFETSDTEMNMETDMNCNIEVPLPIASATQLGGIKVGENLSIAADGTLSSEVSEEDVEQLQEDVSELKEELSESVSGLKSALSPYVIHTIETLGYIAVNGAVNESTVESREVYTDYIPVDIDEALQFLCINAKGTAYHMWGKLALYDNEKTFITRADLFYETTDSSSAKWQNTIPTVKYVRFTYRSGDSVSGKYIYGYITRLIADELDNKLDKVSETTRNLFDGICITGLYLNGTKIATNNDSAIVYIPCEENTTYTVSKTSGARFSVATTNEFPKNNVSISDYAHDNTASSITITTSSGAKYIVAWVYYGTSDVITLEEILASVQIEKSPFATQYIPHNTAVDYIARNNAELSVVDDADGIAGTTTKYVLVLNNDSPFSDGGNCLFAVREGESVSGHMRNDGSVVYPIADQGNLPGANAPIELMDIVKSYVGVSDLRYGNANTMYDTTCTNEIDCSTFVTAVINRIPYEKSRYALGTESSNVLGYNVGNTLLKHWSTGWGRLLTWEMAQWFAEHKRLFTLPSDGYEACNMLQYGDILFGSYESVAERYYGIGHVMFVLGTIPKSKIAIIAQGGTAPESSLYHNNETTTCKVTAIKLDNTTMGSAFKVFARPDYGCANTISNVPLANYVVNGKYQLDVRLLLNLYINASTGTLSIAKSYSGTPDRYKVIPGSTIKFTGTSIDTDENANYAIYCIEYDKDDNYVAYTNLRTGNATIKTNTKYVRFSFGHTESQNVGMTLAKLADFKVEME